MRLIKVVELSKIYIDKNGKERINENYYIQCGAKGYICIKPAFKDGYKQLDLVVEEIIKK